LKTSFFTLGYANWLGLPAPIWLTVACLIVFGFLLNKTTFGRNTLAIGGNEEAARLAGVPVVRTKIIIFVLSGLVSARRDYPRLAYDQRSADDLYRL
jgi:L-arabinose transport system permease protein